MLSSGKRSTGKRVPRAQRLRVQEAGVVGQGLRFAIAGGCVGLIYVATTAVLSEVAGLRFQLALILGFSVAVAAHFTLQRFFVWVRKDGFALTTKGQMQRYAVVSGAQYASTAAATAVVPQVIDVRVLIVYVTWTALASIVNFLVLGRGVFHGSGGVRGSVRAEDRLKHG